MATSFLPPISFSPRLHPIPFPALAFSLSPLSSSFSLPPTTIPYTMEDVDDQMLAAAETLVLCSLPPLKRRPPEIHDLWWVNRPQQVMSLEMMPSFLPPWGLHSRRSRCLCISKKATEEDESLGPAAKTRPSPATPLDFGTTSAPSTSDSDGAPSSSAIPNNKRHRAGDPPPFVDDVYQKDVAVELSPLVRVAITSKPIRRKGKKKTITELQALERSLAGENTMLRKRVETMRRELEALIANNRRLLNEKSSLQHSRAADEATEPRFILPDLNEPAMEIY